MLPIVGRMTNVPPDGMPWKTHHLYGTLIKNSNLNLIVSEKSQTNPDFGTFYKSTSLDSKEVKYNERQKMVERTILD